MIAYGCHDIRQVNHDLVVFVFGGAPDEPL